MNQKLTSFCILILLLLLLPITCNQYGLDPAFERVAILVGEMDYDRTLNINCILNPDSSIQYLAAEHAVGITPAANAAGSERYSQYNDETRYQVFFNRELDITLKSDNGLAAFARRPWQYEYKVPNWDYYSLPDSLLDIDYGTTYTLTTKVDSGLAMSGSTTVPGTFHITSPENYGTTESQNEIKISWTESQDAYGYVILAECNSNNITIKRFVLTFDQTYTYPIGLQEGADPELFTSADYMIDVWAVDKTLYEYFLAEPYDNYSLLNSGIEGAYGIFGSAVIRRVLFIAGDGE